MKFNSPLILVENMEISKRFYQNVLNQKIKFDFGENVVFYGDFSIQLKSHYSKIVGIEMAAILKKSNNFELYFEEEKIEDFIKKLDTIPNIQYIQRCVEHTWGQKVTRFYDPDMHIIEVGESIKSVVKRFLKSGLSIQETAIKTQHPIEFVKMCFNDLSSK